MKQWKIRKTQLTYREDWGNPFHDATPAELLGVKVYVIETLRLGGTIGYWHGNPEEYTLRLAPGRTNLSHEPRVTGWLGTSNDVHTEACGRWEIVGQSSTHLHLIDVDDDDDTAQPAAFVALCQRLDRERQEYLREADARAEERFRALEARDTSAL